MRSLDDFCSFSKGAAEQHAWLHHTTSSCVTTEYSLPKNKESWKNTRWLEKQALSRIMGREIGGRTYLCLLNFFLAMIIDSHVSATETF